MIDGRPMRVAIVSAVPLLNGSESGAAYHTRALADELFHSGLSVEIWSKRGNGKAAQSEAPIVPVWQPGWLAWAGVLRAMRERKPDVLHIQHSMFVLGAGAVGEIAMFFLLMLLRLQRKNVVVTIHDVPALAQVTPAYVRMHGYRFPTSIVHLGLRMIFSMIGHAASAVVVHQDAFANILVEDYNVKRDKIAVIPLIALPQRSVGRDEARKMLGLPAEERIVLFFGYATKYKGIELLLEAAGEVHADLPVRLLLGAGKHPQASRMNQYDAYYRALEKRAGNTPGVAFCGYLPDSQLDEYIEAADLAVFPYIEAQAMSGPVTLCAVHGKPFLVSSRIAEKLPGFRASVFEPRSDALSPAIKRFFNDRAYAESVTLESKQFGASVIGDVTRTLTMNIYRRGERAAVISTSRARA